jgi:hypothetical protein
VFDVTRWRPLAKAAVAEDEAILADDCIPDGPSLLVSFGDRVLHLGHLHLVAQRRLPIEVRARCLVTRSGCRGGRRYRHIIVRFLFPWPRSLSGPTSPWLRAV